MDEYKDLRVTTMTLIFGLKCKIDLNKIFYLLPITRIDFTPSTKARTRYKIPHHNVPGSILSMRYGGQTRGILRTTSSTHFKNSITIDISLKEKNVNIKLCTSKMQMCGAKSLEQGYDGANEIISKIEYISKIIDSSNSDPIKKLNTINYIKENILDTDTVWTLIYQQGLLSPKASSKIYNDLQFKLDSIPHDKEIYDDLTKDFKKFLEPDDKEENLKLWLKTCLKLNTNMKFVTPTQEQMENLDFSFLNFIMSDFKDYHTKELFLQKVDFLKDIDKLYDGPLEIDFISKAMVNFNYSLGNEIDRFQLKKYINGKNGFYAHFDNSTEHYVTVELPYTVEKDQKKRKNKKPCHSFLVYQSGLVTQSGPDEDLMKDAYKQFISIFNTVKQHVIKINN
jgi:hypothetical protein